LICSMAASEVSASPGGIIHITRLTRFAC
jgi:hypothetical protein